MPTPANFSFYKGEDIVVNVSIIPVVNITGWSLKFTMRKTLDILPILITKTTGGGGITITNGPGGIFTITINDADTSSADVGQYLFDIQRTDAGGAQVLTIGNVTLLHPVANIP